MSICVTQRYISFSRGNYTMLPWKLRPLKPSPLTSTRSQASLPNVPDPVPGIPQTNATIVSGLCWRVATFLVVLVDVLLIFNIGFILFLVKFYFGNVRGAGHEDTGVSCPLNVRCWIHVSCHDLLKCLVPRQVMLNMRCFVA